MLRFILEISDKGSLFSLKNAFLNENIKRGDKLHIVIILVNTPCNQIQAN